MLQLRPKYRNWATGSPARGFKLTPIGLLIANETAKLLSVQTSTHSEIRTATKPRTLSPIVELEKKIIKSSAYVKYSEGHEDDIDKMEILELLRAVPNAPFDVLTSYLRQLENIAQEANRPDVIDFLKFIHKKLRDAFKMKVV